MVSLRLRDCNEIVAELDSGTSYHLMPFSLAKALKLQIKPVEANNNPSLRAANGTQIKVSGEATLEVDWGTKELSLPFLVCEGLEQALLSFDLLATLGRNVWIVDPRRPTSEIQLGGEWFHLTDNIFRCSRLRSTHLFTAQDATDDFNSKWVFQTEEQVDPPLENLMRTVRATCDMPEPELVKLEATLDRIAAITMDPTRDRGEFIFTVTLKKGAPPRHIQPTRRMGQAQKQAAREFIEGNLEAGIICRASPEELDWVQNLVFPRKPDGTFRPCMDFVALNSWTIKDVSLIPSVQETFDNMDPTATHFVIVDLKWGFWHVPLSREAQRLSGFWGPDGELNNLPTAASR